MGETPAFAAVTDGGADFLLLDSGAGSGEAFDWASIPDMETPYFLAGGLGLENIDAALAATDAYCYDLSSGAETDGVKDPAKIAALTARVHGYRRQA
jgi:phosphoribosylanthranilate isomerase